jgi:hypothetical protein
MTDPIRFLNAPLGQRGSGRVRYGAAMALWQSGQISAEVLEVYRVTAAHDTRDPLDVLRARGLPLPEMPLKQAPMNRLYSAARDYVLSLDHPGAAEVRAGLPENPGPARAMPARKNAVVDRWLVPALQAAEKDQSELAAAIAAAVDQLEWITYDLYPLDEIGTDFATGHAFASIMGDNSPFAAGDFDLGIFLIAPGVLYRDHRHAAPELYAPLTGPHGWRFGAGRPLIVKPAHQPVWIPPHQPHLTKVGAVPFLCLYALTKDVNEIAEVVLSQDWAEMESQSID